MVVKNPLADTRNLRLLEKEGVAICAQALEQVAIFDLQGFHGSESERGLSVVFAHQIRLVVRTRTRSHRGQRRHEIHSLPPLLPPSPASLLTITGLYLTPP